MPRKTAPQARGPGHSYRMPRGTTAPRARAELSWKERRTSEGRMDPSDPRELTDRLSRDKTPVSAESSSRMRQNSDDSYADSAAATDPSGESMRSTRPTRRAG